MQVVVSVSLWSIVIRGSTGSGGRSKEQARIKSWPQRIRNFLWPVPRKRPNRRFETFLEVHSVKLREPFFKDVVEG
jgi:hypothetical protein